MRALALLSFLTAAVLAGCASQASPDAPPNAAPSVQAASDLEAGHYLVEVGSCHDCHTPGFMENPVGIPDSLWLTGGAVGFRGPWGTSYPRNLRLFVQELTEDQWVARLQGSGLPPMPWPAVNELSEPDARAIYRYIRSLGPAGQQAPRPVPPGEEPATPYMDFVVQHLERLGAAPSVP